VIEVSTDGKAMVKCDFCIERSRMGQEPACVEGCPTKALTLDDERQLAASKRRRAAQEIVSSMQKTDKKTEQRENTQ